METRKRKITVSTENYSASKRIQNNLPKTFTMTQFGDSSQGIENGKMNGIGMKKTPSKLSPKEHHNKPPQKPQNSDVNQLCRCFLCNCKFETKLHLFMHLNCAHEVYLYQCGFCNQKFMTSNLLERHINEHIQVVQVPDVIEVLEESENEGNDNHEISTKEDDFSSNGDHYVVTEADEMDPLQLKRAVKLKNLVPAPISEEKPTFEKSPEAKPESQKEKESSIDDSILNEFLQFPPNDQDNSVKDEEFPQDESSLDDLFQDDFFQDEPFQEENQTKKKAHGSSPKKKRRPMRKDRRTRIRAGPQMCDQCGNMQINLKSHIKEMHCNREKCPKCRTKLPSNPDKEHVCNVKFLKHLCKCGDSFGIREYMIAHVVEHNSPDHEINCHRCEKTFRNFKDLNQHSYTEHPDPFLCESCPRSFVTKELLYNHVSSTHISTIPLKCEICGRICYGKVRLKRHLQKVHTKDHRVMCNACGKSCRDKYSYQKHVETVHEGKLDFECSACKRGFASQAGLRYHLASHTGERKFPCPFCSKGFKINAELRKHYRSAHKDVTLKCPSCTVHSKDEDELKLHLNRYPSHNPNFKKISEVSEMD
ncbi:hypothetical protein DMENIID0001_019610 [Sergentomyia squamirostris]